MQKAKRWATYLHKLMLRCTIVVLEIERNQIRSEPEAIKSELYASAP